jgi:addiction module RelE/StbE family toxin
MKRSVVEGPKFKKQFKKVSQYKNFKKQKFVDAVTMLQSGEQLPKMYDDHPVAKHSPKALQGMRIMHVAPNICVIYELTDSEVILNLIGSHQDLNLTESHVNKNISAFN